MPSLSRSSVGGGIDGFTAKEYAFALAWELYAPGLGGWTVQHDSDDDGEQSITVDPPLVYGDGFVLRKDAAGISIKSPLGAHRAASLRDALLLICPLGRDELDAAERMAALPTADLSLHFADAGLDPVPDGDAQVNAVKPGDFL